MLTRLASPMRCGRCRIIVHRQQPPLPPLRVALPSDPPKKTNLRNELDNDTVVSGEMAP
jgi:hypothetical protein